MKTRPALIAAALVASLTLPSCYVYWNTGKCIRDTATAYKGYDTQNPVGDVIYKDKNDQYYMQAQEVTFKATHEWVSVINFLDWGRKIEDKVYARKVKPTGNVRWVRVNGDGSFEHFHLYPPSVKEVYDTKPAGLKVFAKKDEKMVANGKENRIEFYGAQETGSTGYLLCAIAAAPFDYVVDPVLTVACDATVVVVGGAAAIITSPLWITSLLTE